MPPVIDGRPTPALACNRASSRALRAGLLVALAFGCCSQWAGAQQPPQLLAQQTTERLPQPPTQLLNNQQTPQQFGQQPPQLLPEQAAQRLIQQPPLPPELSVWNWLRQSQWAPQDSYARSQTTNRPQGSASPALWETPASGLLPVPDAQLTSASTGPDEPRLNQGALIEAVPPVEPVGRERGLTQTVPIELAQQPAPPPAAAALSSDDTGIQAAESPDAVGPSTPGPNADKKMGKAPVDYTRQFLRTQSVLIKQGQWQFDTGAAYGTLETTAATVYNGNLVNENLHRRLGYVPVQLRYGLTDRVQLFANVPVGYVCNQTSVLGTFSNYSGRGGTGDTNIGATYWLRKSNGCPFDPDIITTAGVTFPTAPASFLTADSTPQTSLGQGFWAAIWNVLVIQSFDPVTVFYGVGGRQLFGRDLDGTQVQPGQQFTYQLGAGFAVNERITLSTSYFGYFITDTYLNHQRLEGSFLEPQYIRMALTVAGTNRIVEPFILFGLTQDSARTIIGINLTYY